MSNIKMWKIIRRLLQRLKGSGPIFVTVIIIAIIGTIMQVLCPKVLGEATTLIFTNVKNTDAIDFTKLRTILIVVSAMYCITFLASFVQIRLMTVISLKMAKGMRNELKEKMNTVPINYFDKNSNGNLMSIAVNDIDSIATSMEQSITELVSNIVLVVGILGIMFFISWQLTLLSFTILLGSMAVIKIMLPLTKKHTQEYMQLQGTLGGYIEESYNGHAVIKSFNGEKGAIDKFKNINDMMYKPGWIASFFGGSTKPTIRMMANIVYMFIVIVGGIFVSKGSMSIGDLQAFLIYFTLFSQPITQFTIILNAIVSGTAAAKRVFEVLDAEDIPKLQTVFPDKKCSGEKVCFDRIKFGYNEKILMHNFSLDVENGQMVAIVGHTGAGKTTLINLLERFYDIQSGSIRIDGIDIRNMTQTDLRKRIGMVLQDTWLFSGTIYDNIKYGNENASNEQVIQAAKAAYVDDFVRTLPDGYDTVLNEEASNISQGQRQLITIARAFVANPEILILDEATSNVDSRTEMLIQKAMRKLSAGRTSFVVAHRLSTIYDADNIIVMNEGDIVEMDKHEELLRANGVYADIYNSQFALNHV